MGAEAGERKDWKQRPHLLWGKTGTTATLVQLERAPTVRMDMGGEGSPQLPWKQSPAPQGRGLAGVSMGQGQILSSPAALCPPGAVTVSPSHLSGQQQPQSQYLQVIHRADPPHPSFLPSLGFGRFSRGWVGRRESSRQTLPSPPPSSQTTGLGPQRLLTSALAQRGQGAADWSHHDRGKGCFAPSPSFLQGRVQTRQDGAPQGFAPEGGFWARVCKAIFLCGGKGRQGMNTGCGERGGMAERGGGRGLPAGAQSLESFERKNTHVHKIHSGPAPSPSSLAPPHLSGPLLRPQRRFWGYSCRTVHSGPTLRCPQPLLPF